MTKGYICDKIFCMKKTLYNKKLLILLLSFFALLFIAIGLSVQFYTVKAEEQASAPRITPLIPSSNVEYYDFTDKAPYKATRFDGGIAIVASNRETLGESSENLWIYTQKEGKYIEYDKFTGKEILHIYALDKNTLIVNAQFNLYKVDLNDLTKEPTKLIEDGFDDFSINTNYLVARAGTSISIYKKINGAFTLQETIRSIVADKTPLAINGKNQLFYITESTKLTVRTIGTDQEYDVQNQATERRLFTLNSTPTALIANTEYVYWISSVADTVCRVSIESGLSSDMLIAPSEGFELGSIISPTSLAFYNQNLIISDSQLEAVEEFEISDNKLTFTGFAVAKNKTAFNRVSNNISAMDRYNDNLVILDSNKLTIIKTNENFNSLDKNCFTNYWRTSLQFDSYEPSMIATGNSKILLGYLDNSLRLLDINSSELTITDAPSISHTLKDVYYSRGRFYVLSLSGSGSTITSFNEDGSDVITTEVSSSVFAEKLAVDLLGRVYVSDQYKIYRNGIELCSNPTDFKGFALDLCGNVFAISGKSVVFYNEEYEGWETAYTSTLNITNLSLNYDRQDIYFTNENCEIVYTLNLPQSSSNTSINDIEYPLNLDTHKQTTNGDFKAYTVKDGAFVSWVLLEDKLVFNGLSSEVEFAFLERLEVNTVNGKKYFSLLAGIDGIAFTHAENVEEKEVSFTPLTDKKIYVTTPVHAYALPIITVKNTYAIQTTIDEQVKPITLNKGVVLKATKAFNFLNQDYYYVTVSEGESSYTCYIPQSFTVDILSEDLAPSTYTFSQVEGCKLYKDSALTQEITNLSDGTQVRIYSNDGKVCKIAVKVNGEFIEGYVKADNILDTPNTTVRNILIILAVLACLCGTTTFFLLRKKS